MLKNFARSPYIQSGVLLYIQYGIALSQYVCIHTQTSCVDGGCILVTCAFTTHVHITDIQYIVTYF